MADVPAYATELMQALGPQTGAIDWVGFDREHASWQVGFDNQSAVLLEWFGEQECFVIHALLGTPPPQGRVAVYEAVLAYNAMWRDNGGARIGMVHADGELALMVELPARTLTLQQLQAVLLGVKSHAEAWCLCVARPGGAERTDRAAAPSPLDRV